jgi:hypothetical protein
MLLLCEVGEVHSLIIRFRGPRYAQLVMPRLCGGAKSATCEMRHRLYLRPITDVFNQESIIAKRVFCSHLERAIRHAERTRC